MLRNIKTERDGNLEPLEDPTQVSGFASPAADYLQDRLHIVQRLVTDPTNTYYFEMDSNELLKFGISKDALLVVDRSLKPKIGSTVVAHVEGEWIVRRICEHNNKKYLASGKVDSKAVLISEEGVSVFGVVTWSCNPLADLVNHIIE